MPPDPDPWNDVPERAAEEGAPAVRGAPPGPGTGTGFVPVRPSRSRVPGRPASVPRPRARQGCRGQAGRPGHAAGETRAGPTGRVGRGSVRAPSTPIPHPGYDTGPSLVSRGPRVPGGNARAPRPDRGRVAPALKRRQPPGGCGPGAAVVSVELKRRRGCIVPAPATESAEIDERTRENGSQHRRGRDLTGAHESPCPGSRPSGEAMGRESRARHHPVRLPGLRWPPPERRSPRIGQGCAPTARRRIAAAGLNVLKEPERRARQTRQRAEPVRSRARSQPLRTVEHPRKPRGHVRESLGRTSEAEHPSP
jgi:hypothetical protein